MSVWTKRIEDLTFPDVEAFVARQIRESGGTAKRPNDECGARRGFGPRAGLCRETIPRLPL
jgi:hypothetical protein